MIQQEIRIEKAQQLISNDVLKYAMRYMKQDGEITITSSRNLRSSSLTDTQGILDLQIQDKDLLTVSVVGDDEQQHFEEIVKLLNATVTTEENTLKVKEIVKENLLTSGMHAGTPFLFEHDLFILMDHKELKSQNKKVDHVVTAFRPSTNTIHVLKINPKEIMNEKHLVEYHEATYLQQKNDEYAFKDHVTDTIYQVNNVSFPVMTQNINLNGSASLVYYNNQPVFVIPKENKPISSWFVIDDISLTDYGIYALATVKEGTVKNGMTFMVIDENRSFAFNYVMVDLEKPLQKGQSFKFRAYPKWSRETYAQMCAKHPDDVIQKNFVFEHIHGAHTTARIQHEDLVELERRALAEGLSDDILLHIGRGFKASGDMYHFEQNNDHFANAVKEILKDCSEIPHEISQKVIKSFGMHKMVHLVIALVLLSPFASFLFRGEWLSLTMYLVMIIAGFVYKKLIGALVAAVGGYVYITVVGLIFPLDYAARFALIALFLYRAYINNYHEKDLTDKYVTGRRDERIAEVKRKIRKIQNEVKIFNDMIVAKLAEYQANEQKFFNTPFKRTSYQGILNPKEENVAYTKNMELLYYACYLEMYYTYDTEKHTRSLEYNIPYK